MNSCRATEAIASSFRRRVNGIGINRSPSVAAQFHLDGLDALGSVALVASGCVRQGRLLPHASSPSPPSSKLSPPRSAFAGFRFPPDAIVLAVRRFLRFGLSYRAVVS